MSLVEARDLFCVYPGADGGVAALQGLTLDVEEGEVCVILGPRMTQISPSSTSSVRPWSAATPPSAPG